MAAPLTSSGPTFEAGLAEHIRVGNETPFELGRMDCSLWVADWVRQRTGMDLAADFRGRYQTRSGYLRLLIPLGNLVRVAGRRLDSVDAEAIPVSEARLGDIGIVATTDGPALAICGPDGWVAKTADGLLPADHATFAWRLP